MAPDFNEADIDVDVAPRLQCSCGGWMLLEFSDVGLSAFGRTASLENVPILVCPTCQARHLPNASRHLISDAFSETTELTFKRTLSLQQLRQSYSSHNFPPFDFDVLDYMFIPGLLRPWNNGSLTPIFFNKEVLLKYMHHPQYRIEFVSDTYGSVYSQDSHLFPFGINRRGRVIAWLTDIAKLDDREQLYLRSENVVSDHDIASEFYRAQIDIEFTDASQQHQLLIERFGLLQTCIETLGIKISQYDLDISETLRELLRPVVWTNREVGHVWSTLNKVLVETLSSSDLKQRIQYLDPAFRVDKLGSLKLFEAWISKELPGADYKGIASPFFVVNDLRQTADHLMISSRDEVMAKCYERLHLDHNSADLPKLHDSLLDMLIKSYRELANAVRNKK